MDLNSYKTNKELSPATPQEDFLKAASEGNFSTVATLSLSPLVAVNHANSSGYTALILAACRGDLETVKVLLNIEDILVNKPDPLFGASALIWAVQNKHLSVVKKLCQRQDLLIDQPNRAGKTAVYLAAELGYNKIAKVLMAHGAVLIEPTDPCPSNSILKMTGNDNKELSFTATDKPKNKRVYWEAGVMGEGLGIDLTKLPLNKKAKVT